MLDLFLFLRPADGLLIFGVFSLFLALTGTCSGESFERFGRVIFRAEEPKPFWWSIATWYVMGVGFVGYYLYKVYGLYE